MSSWRRWRSARNRRSTDVYATAPDPRLLASVEPGLFRETLGRFATGVAFVTASADGEPLGMVVNALSSVSLDPPLLLFCPGRDSFTWRRMRRSGRFGVNVLEARDEEFVRRATPAGADRFAGVRWRPSAAGVPILEDALAFAGCGIESVIPAGDHWIVVGRVEEAWVDREGDPLVFWAGSFGGLA
jgi:3-hydroxy-9,10-secoandrosta-1,3,5(10)-triene-9,17-dione monooxygenase reductase component